MTNGEALRSLRFRGPRSDCKPRVSLVFARSVPLTPALSLREREHHRQCIRQPEPLGVIATRSLVLLSLRERAGVRGNGPWKVQTAGVLHLAPKFQNVTAIGQSGNIFLLLQPWDRSQRRCRRRQSLPDRG